VFNPEGELLIRQFHDYVETRPRLHTNEEGVTTVLGGVRHETPYDVPPPKPAPTLPEAPKPIGADQPAGS
jgi:hypothetical protein